MKNRFKSLGLCLFLLGCDSPSKSEEVIKNSDLKTTPISGENQPPQKKHPNSFEALLGLKEEVSTRESLNGTRTYRPDKFVPEENIKIERNGLYPNSEICVGLENAISGDLENLIAIFIADERWPFDRYLFENYLIDGRYQTFLSLNLLRANLKDKFNHTPVPWKTFPREKSAQWVFDYTNSTRLIDDQGNIETRNLRSGRVRPKIGEVWNPPDYVRLRHDYFAFPNPKNLDKTYKIMRRFATKSPPEYTSNGSHLFWRSPEMRVFYGDLRIKPSKLGFWTSGYNVFDFMGDKGGIYFLKSNYLLDSTSPNQLAKLELFHFDPTRSPMDFVTPPSRQSKSTTQRGPISAQSHCTLGFMFTTIEK